MSAYFKVSPIFRVATAEKMVCFTKFYNPSKGDVFGARHRQTLPWSSWPNATYVKLRLFPTFSACARV